MRRLLSEIEIGRSSLLPRELRSLRELHYLSDLVRPRASVRIEQLDAICSVRCRSECGCAEGGQRRGAEPGSVPRAGLQLQQLEKDVCSLPQAMCCIARTPEPRRKKKWVWTLLSPSTPSLLEKTCVSWGWLRSPVESRKGEAWTGLCLGGLT